MSYYDYQESRNIPGHMPFAALIMAAARRADNANFELLVQAFPEIVGEAETRYDAPGGRLPSDPDGGA